MVDIPGDSTTTSVIGVGGTAAGVLEVMGDHDWYRIQLTAGQSISVALDGLTLEDSNLRIYDAAGTLLFENDDINPGIERDSLLAFTATNSGTYYIDVGAFDEGYTGTYQLSVSTYTPPPVATIPQIADQLVNGYWGGDQHRFNVSPGGAITVNFSALTPSGQSLARDALSTWTDVIGVRFVEITSGGQIIFDDNEEGAFSDGTWLGGFISAARVNVSTQWLTDYGTGKNTYSFQTYVHEIGHALGLGHVGNYNETARYPFEALFQNDSWAVSAMSYFSQTENTYFAGQGFTENHLLTPMMADILAMSTLYGLSTTTRSGDTTYTFGSAGSGAQTIFDAGGIDWIYGTGHSGVQLINLNPGTFSNIHGDVGNVSIAFGTTIEHAIGGAGADTLIGNDAGNRLEGGEGNDTLRGGAGNDALLGDAGNNTLDGGTGADTAIFYSLSSPSAVTVNLLLGTAVRVDGTGQDKLTSIENVSGTQGDDSLTGNDQANDFEGGAGNDVLNGNGGNDQLRGDQGNDSLDGGAGDDVLDGGAGSDIVLGGAGNDRILYDAADTQVDGGAGTDVLVVQDMAAPTNFNLSSRQFERAEVTQADPGDNPWASIFSIYNLSWGLVQRVTTNDDASRVVVDVDHSNAAATSQVWSSFDAQGRLSSVDQLFDNGTRTFINADEANANPWVQNWFNFDAQGRLDSQDVLYDNGTRTFINLDQAGTQGFAQDWFVYDAQGRLDSQDVHYDNGTRTFINFDQAGNLSFIQDWFAYDAQGRLDSQDVYHDNGSRTFINLDQDNSQSWRQAWFTYDAQGRLDTQDVLNDDGSRTFTNYDQAGTEPFTLAAFLYNPDGSPYQQVTVWDNGTTTYTLL